MTDTFTAGHTTVTRIENEDDKTWTWEWRRGELILQVEYAHAAQRWHYASAHSSGGGWTVNERPWPKVRERADAEKIAIEFVEGKRH